KAAISPRSRTPRACARGARTRSCAAKKRSKRTMSQPSLFDLLPNADAGPPAPPDQAVRDFAVDPRHHVVLEASAGTGKTRVLVERYVRLVESGVDPRHILAM